MTGSSPAMQKTVPTTVHPGNKNQAEACFNPHIQLPT